MIAFRSVLACAALTAAGLSQSAVSPSDRAQLEGSSFTHFPLGRFNARMQTLHSDLPPLQIVHGHAFRRDAVTVRGIVDAFAVDLEVTLSLAPHAPSQASGTFANNVGTGAVAVLPRTTVAFPSTDRPQLDPAPSFDLMIPYQVPFVLPAQPATVCVDTVIFGNVSAAGPDRNLSIYLDAHENYADGRNEQPGFRTGSGCAAPGRTAAAFATMSLWHLGTSMRLDVAARNGVPDDGTGLARTFVCLGAGRVQWPWPLRPACVQQSSCEVWFALPNPNDTSGNNDASLSNLPVLPPGHRLWCQAGSIHLQSGDFAFGDASTLITPPAGPAQIPAARIVASSDRSAASGTVSFAVPVIEFF